MLYIYTANVKEGQLKEYQQWVTNNEGRIRKVAPDGWKLRGVYFPVFGFGRALTEIHWDIDNYAAFDVAHAACLKGSPYFELVGEWYSYLDVKGQRGRLLKDVTSPETLVGAE
jgi:hypothetical protein